MKQIRYLFGGLLFLFASTGSVTAQEVSDYSKLQPSDYSSITLPPLDLLFENAKSAPTYELATVKEQIVLKIPFFMIFLPQTLFNYFCIL